MAIILRAARLLGRRRTGPRGRRSLYLESGARHTFRFSNEVGYRGSLHISLFLLVERYIALLQSQYGARHRQCSSIRCKCSVVICMLLLGYILAVQQSRGKRLQVFQRLGFVCNLKHLALLSFRLTTAERFAVLEPLLGLLPWRLVVLV